MANSNASTFVDHHGVVWYSQWQATVVPTPLHGCFKPDWQANLTIHFHGCPDPPTPKCQCFLSPILIQVDNIATISVLVCGLRFVDI